MAWVDRNNVLLSQVLENASQSEQVQLQSNGDGFRSENNPNVNIQNEDGGESESSRIELVNSNHDLIQPSLEDNPAN